MSVQTKRKKKEPANGKQKPVSFSALPDEIERWRSRAKNENRTVSSWIRLRLLTMDDLEFEKRTDVQEKA